MNFIWSPCGVTAMKSHNFWSPHEVHVEYVDSSCQVIWNSRYTHVNSMWSQCGVQQKYLESIWSLPEYLKFMWSPCGVHQNIWSSCGVHQKYLEFMWSHVDSTKEPMRSDP